MNSKCDLTKSSIVQPHACTARRMMSKFLLHAEFSRSKIINHRFYVENDMIIGRDLMVQLFLTADFKHQVL